MTIPTLAPRPAPSTRPTARTIRAALTVVVGDAILDEAIELRARIEILVENVSRLEGEEYREAMYSLQVARLKYRELAAKIADLVVDAA